MHARALLGWIQLRARAKKGEMVPFGGFFPYAQDYCPSSTEHRAEVTSSIFIHDIRPQCWIGLNSIERQLSFGMTRRKSSSSSSCFSQVSEYFRPFLPLLPRKEVMNRVCMIVFEWPPPSSRAMLNIEMFV